MNVFAKFDEIPLMILEVIKETKRYGRYEHTVGRSDNVKTVYPPTNTVCGGYKKILSRGSFRTHGRVMGNKNFFIYFWPNVIFRWCSFCCLFPCQFPYCIQLYAEMIMIGSRVATFWERATHLVTVT